MCENTELKKEEKQYEFRPDLELKYLFTHAERSSVIKLLNCLFRTSIPEDSSIEISNTEFVNENVFKSKLYDRRADMLFTSEKLHYKIHLEFQSTNDPTMGLRAFLYGLYTGIETLEENRIDFPFSHILYTTTGKDKKGKDIIKLCFPKMSEDGTHCEETIIPIEVEYTNLLAMDFKELTSEHFILLSFMYFYRYIKDKRKIGSDKKVLNVVKELQKYVTILEKIKQQDRDILLRAADALLNDILHIIQKQEKVSKEVTDMLLEEYKTIADIRVEKAEQKGLQKGRAEGRAEEREEGRAEGREEGREEERENSIHFLVKSFKNIGVEESKILEQLQEVYKLSKEDAQKYL